jgi:hypothetical protein
MKAVSVYQILRHLKGVLMEVTVPVIACGGIRDSGDIAKLKLEKFGNSGSLLRQRNSGAIIEKSNGLYKRYRGAF